MDKQETVRLCFEWDQGPVERMTEVLEKEFEKNPGCRFFLNFENAFSHPSTDIKTIITCIEAGMMNHEIKVVGIVLDWNKLNVSDVDLVLSSLKTSGLELFHVAHCSLDLGSVISSIRNNGVSIKNMDFEGNKITESSTQTLVSWIMSGTCSLNSLYLENCSLSPDSIVSIFQSLRNSTNNIQVFDISSTIIPNDQISRIRNEIITTLSSSNCVLRSLLLPNEFDSLNDIEIKQGISKSKQRLFTPVMLLGMVLDVYLPDKPRSHLFESISRYLLPDSYSFV